MATAEEYASRDVDADGTDGTHLTLEVWHPDCWTLEVTETNTGSLLAHTVYNATDGRIKGHFTAYSDSAAELRSLIDAVDASQLTESVVVLQRRHGTVDGYASPSKAARELFVEYDPGNTISDALISRGFIQEAPVRITGGREYWSVFVIGADRDHLRERLETVRETEDATIEVLRITSSDGGADDVETRVTLLTDRQREIFELACEHGYYTWPRTVTTRELAAHADISKTTLLEHLRKAEAKLLDPAVDELSRPR